MAGAGKSSIGKKIASSLGFEFIDSDRLIERDYAMNLQEVLNFYGQEKFREIEESIILGIDFDQIILATGGSVIFSNPAMNHIQQSSHIIFLDVSYENILRRISSLIRGVSSRNQTKLTNRPMKQGNLCIKNMLITLYKTITQKNLS